MVKFPALSHGYSLVTSPHERAVFQNLKFGKLNTLTINLTFLRTILQYSSKVLASIHAIPLFARLSKAHYRDL